MNPVIINFIRYCKGERKSKETLYAYERELIRFFDWYDGNVKDLTIYIIDEYIMELADQEIGASACKRSRSVLATFMKYLVKYRLLPFGLETNTEDIMRINQPAPKNPTYITELQLLKMLQVLMDNPDKDTDRNMALLSVMFYTGMRPKEIISMKTSWIKEDELQVAVDDGKGGVDRFTIINSLTIKLIKRYVGEREGIIFVNDEGSPFYDTKPLRNLIEKLKRLDTTIPKNITPYSCRRGFAINYYLKSNHNIEATRKLLGHKKITTTQLYLRGVDFENIYKEQDKVEKSKIEILKN